MSGKKNLSPLLKLVIPSHALVGLIWQVSLITSLYLKYDVVTETEIKIPYNVRPVSIIYCPYLPSILSKDKLEDIINERNIAYSIPKGHDGLKVENLVTFLTTQDLFNLTPHEQDVKITKCRYRIPQSYLMDNTDCRIIFKVSRYLRSQYMCYRFSLQMDEFVLENEEYWYSFHQVKNTISHPGLLFEVTLDGTRFADALFFSASVYNNLLPPVGDSDFPVLVSNEENRNRSSRARLVLLEDEDNEETGRDREVVSSERGDERKGLSHDRYKRMTEKEDFRADKKYQNRRDEFSFAFKTVHNSLLPSPFVTHCRDWTAHKFLNTWLTLNESTVRKELEVESQADAVSKCIWHATVSMLDRVPLTSNTWDPRKPIKLVSLQDLENRTFSKIYTSIKNRCTERFQFVDCENRDFVTKLLQRNFRSAKNSSNKELKLTISFRVYIPDGPALVTICSEKLALTQFLVYLFNCFSTWFGISLFDLHSFLIPKVGVKVYRK